MVLVENLLKLRNFLSKDQNKTFNLFILLSIFAMIFEILSISLIVPLIKIFTEGNISIPYFSFNFSIEKTVVIFFLIFFFIFSVKNSFLVYFERKKYNFIYQIRSSVSEKVFQNYINQNFLFHLNNNSSILVRNINDISHILGIIKSWIVLLTEIFIVIGITAFLFYFDPLITILSIFFLTCIGYFFYKKIQTKAKKWGEDRQYHDGLRLIKLNEGFGAIKDIKLLGKENFFTEEFSKHNKNSAISEFYHSFVLSLPRIIFEWVLVMCVMLLVFFILNQGKGIDYALSIMSLFVVAAFRLMPSITRIMNSLQAIKYSGPALEVLTSHLNNLKSNKIIKEKINSKNIKVSFLNKIELKNVSFSFKDKKKQIISNLSCAFKAGSKIGIIGDSGSGKTTLINLIVGLLSPSEGKILIDGLDISENKTKWQSLIGYVPQNIFLLDDTLIKNIALGNNEKDIDFDRVKNLVQITKLSNLVNKSNQNINLKVGELGDSISGGERQRIGIARALYRNPEILILDESTSALDLSTEEEIIKDIHSIMKDKTMIIISHRKSTLQKCDEIFNLNMNSLTKI